MSKKSFYAVLTLQAHPLFIKNGVLNRKLQEAEKTRFVQGNYKKNFYASTAPDGWIIKFPINKKSCYADRTLQVHLLFVKNGVFNRKLQDSEKTNFEKKFQLFFELFFQLFSQLFFQNKDSFGGASKKRHLEVPETLRSRDMASFRYSKKGT